MKVEDMERMAEREQAISRVIYQAIQRKTMKTTMKGKWISVAENPPSEGDLPAWFHGGEDRDVHLFTTRLPSALAGYTSWQHAEVPAPPPREPPPRELTQREKDEQAYASFVEQPRTLYGREIWHAALKWEREQCEEALMALAYPLPYVPGAYLDRHVIEAFFRARREGGAK